MGAIRFFTEDISFKLSSTRKRSAWIRRAIESEKAEVGSINFIFCSDEHLHGINRQYLDHDNYTDIITFDNAEAEGLVEGDIFISIERVQENATRLAIPFEDELDRVLIHGVLHLLGYDDLTATQTRVMRKKEDAYLSLR